MKYLMVILDGAVDHPLKELEQKTPLMAASGEHLKAMARKARVGAVQSLQPDWQGDVEASLMSLFGYDPREHFTGRGALEAAAMEIGLDRADVGFSVNLVHMDGTRLLDPVAGGLPKAAGRELAIHVQETLRIRDIQFFPGAGARHVAVWRDGPDGIRCTPPYAAQGERLRDHFPTGDRAERLIGVMWDSAEVLADHPINKRRRDDGKPTADMIWPWAPGRAPVLQGWGFRHGVGGACVAGSQLVKGLARLTGLRVVDVPGATGSLDTDYAMKARATLSALERFPFCLVHLESPNAASLAGDLEAKLDAIRHIDERYFGTLLDKLGKLDDFRILVVVDHPTYVEERKAVPGWTPFMITGSLERAQTRGSLPFDERATEDAKWRVDDGWRLLDQLFEGEPG
jgi:2,3-bisphosphoglycerate-independent phosphoglycerate mutase